MDRTRVGIIGAGPAGLLLGQLLTRAGIDNVIVESRTRQYCEQRQRAGMLEQNTVDILRDCGAGERLEREGLTHEGIELRFDRASHHIDFPALVGRTVTIYAQTEIVKDLIALRTQPLLFSAEALSADPASGVIRYSISGRTEELACDYIAACDGFHGVGRSSLPAVTSFSREYPFAWLGILASVPPSCTELIYAHHERGFALHSMRSPHVSRLYLQVSPDEELELWPDERIWDELSSRFAIDADWTLQRGPITDKGITPMRSFVAEPMRAGRLFLAGDAAHIVPPTGAKGLNLAVADVARLADALVDALTTGSQELLDAYSSRALARVWRAEHFSHVMTSMLHADPHQDRFDYRLQLSQLRYTATSPAAMASLAENYTGLPLDWLPSYGSAG